ncbi:molybdate ABC transporter substrate-binding protein [Polynucleobacter kasalickyi]|uniref:Molybdate transport system substrate-binding protein n=1 Tax=Polynucleobacter kasalickyi TaxID=1938817 RepID=A0A1W2BFK5_9BURK|nr:substrate-binding domain-containing protein [Polynucleobacter kasalickyi]SMC71636.1 molybdate transport system substrate-binding protein [Polynucleobacter kasalickyi]
MELVILSGGAAAGVVRGVQADFEKNTSCSINATFNAVGQMRDQLIGGGACDLIILTKQLIDLLIASGHVIAGSEQSLGLVKTGVAIKSGKSAPAISTREELLETLLSAKGIYFPDPEKATAGIHVMSVLKALGLDKTHSDKFRTYPNGAVAMAAMAACDEEDLIGSTQVTEINITPGCELIGLLPKEFELATDYTLGICTNAKNPELAKQLANILTGSGSAEIRKKIGFEF